MSSNTNHHWHQILLKSILFLLFFTAGQKWPAIPKSLTQFSILFPFFGRTTGRNAKIGSGTLASGYLEMHI